MVASTFHATSPAAPSTNAPNSIEPKLSRASISSPSGRILERFTYPVLLKIKRNKHFGLYLFSYALIVCKVSCRTVDCDHLRLPRGSCHLPLHRVIQSRHVIDPQRQFLAPT